MIYFPCGKLKFNYSLYITWISAFLSQCAVDGLAVLVDGVGEIIPMAIDLNVCFIHSVTFVHREFLAFPKGCLQLRRELLNSAVNVGMVKVLTGNRQLTARTPDNHLYPQV